MKFLNHSKVSYNKFLHHLNIFSRTKEEVVNVGNYVTTHKLAPILDHLLSKHGDIGAESTLSPKLTLFFFCILCECIDRMRNTMVVDITNNILPGRWASLKTLQFAGFKIEFGLYVK